MTDGACRILFNAHNRRGLGHLMRGLNMARAVRELRSDAEIVLYTRSETVNDLCGDGFRYVIAGEQDEASRWTKLIEQFDPKVIVYDTMLPKAESEAPAGRGHVAYVMRKCKPERQQEIFQHAFMDQAALILIPHDPEEFGYELPVRLRDKAHFLGPIIRSPDENAQARLREKYRIKPGELLLTSTVGGGGFQDRALSFFETVYAVQARLSGQVPTLRHLVIKGPNFGAELPEADGIQVIDSEPEMVNLLAISDLVIAEGGYNTVNEIRLAKTPAIFLPSARHYDDQTERVEDLARRGLAYVFTEREPEPIATLIRRYCQEPELGDALRERYREDKVATGNRSAGEKLIELAQS